MTSSLILPPPPVPWYLRAFRRRDIADPSGALYLRRFTLFRCRWFRVFLHRIYKPDPDRDMHNHPWRAVCIVLRGWYVEHRARFGDPFWYHWPLVVRHVNKLRPDYYHRIVEVSDDLWTLCIAGPRYREWGFKSGGRHIDWREYLALPTNTDLED